MLCLAAALPLVVLLVVLLRGGAVRVASGLSCLLAVGLGALVFGGSLPLLLAAGAAGLRQSLPIVAVVFLTLLLYIWAEAAGGLVRLQAVLQGCSAELAVQALVIGWLFAHVLQGVSGFGVPVLVCVPLLQKIGIPAARAVLIALLGQCWGNTFGTLGLAWDGMMQQAALSPVTAAETLVQASSYLLLVCIVTGWLIAYLADGWRGVRRTFGLVLVLGFVQGEGQTIFAGASPELANFLASLVGMGAFFAWQKVREQLLQGRSRVVCERPSVAGVGEARRISLLVTRWPEFLRQALWRTWPVAVTIALLLVMAEVMMATGQTKVLAGAHYVLAAPFVGLLGSFMTASNLSSNILFTGFQQQMAGLLAWEPEVLLALQTAGGAVGTLLSPSNVLLGTTAAGIADQEGKVLRGTLPVALLFCAVFGLLAAV